MLELATPLDAALRERIAAALAPLAPARTCKAGPKKPSEINAAPPGPAGPAKIYDVEAGPSVGQPGPEIDERLYAPLFYLDELRKMGLLCPIGDRHAATALAFIRDGWADRALRLDWSMHDLFGADGHALWARLDRLGCAYLAAGVIAITDKTMTLGATQGARLTLRRGRRSSDQAFPWEVIERRLISDPTSRIGRVIGDAG